MMFNPKERKCFATMKCKVVTFNLRMDTFADKNNYFFLRAPLILEKIRAERPDVIGFQEAREPIYEWLKGMFPEYEFVGIGREKDFSDEANPIAFRRDRFSLFSFTQFWLSETPEIPGSRYKEQSPCPRVCTAVELKENAGQSIFRFYNTHLDHVGEKARLLGMEQILRKIGEDYKKRASPVILTGDMNAYPDEAAIRAVLLWERPALSDLTQEVGKSFHGFDGGSPFEAGEKIDYIFASQSVKPLALSVWDLSRGGVYLSDHYPISALVEVG